MEATLSLPQTLLLDGANVVTVQALLDPGIAYSIFYVDYFDITYRVRLITVQSLRAGTPS